MSPLDALFNRGNTAQMPGAMSQPSGLAKLFAPEVALPMAAMLLGGQGNAQNFGNAFAAGGQAIGQQKQLQAQTAKENQTLEFFKQKAPEYAEMVAAGMPVNEAWKQYTEQRFAQQAKPTASIQEYEYAKQNGQFDGSFTDWQTKGIREQDPTFTREKDLRGQYDQDPNVKNYKIVRDNYERIREGTQLTTGAGDIAVVFGYMKMLDPTSVVRETEQATVENATGVPAQVRNLWNKVYAGERLPPEARAEIAAAADQIYQQSAGNVEDTNNRYGGIADRYKLDRSGIVQEPEKYEPLQIGQTKEVAPGVTIRKVR